MTVTFCGHAKMIYDMKQAIQIYNNVEMLINNGANEFLLGGYGVFDLLCASIVKKLEEIYPHINSTLILAYSNGKYDKKLYDSCLNPFDEANYYKSAIIKRNMWMVDNADVVISGVMRDFGGAVKTHTYAQKCGKKIILIK